MGRRFLPLAFLAFGCAMSCGLGAAHAQCGATPSSCRQCHEIDGRAPKPSAAPWHADHAFGDFCASCHGGAPTAPDVAVAHAGLVDPMGDPSPCAPCHADATQRLSAYRTVRRAEAGAAPAPPPSPPTPGARPPRASSGNVVLATLAALVALVGPAYVVRNERRLRGRTSSPVLPRLRQAEWSPYVAGGLLGLVVAISMALFGHRLSGGGAYVALATPLGHALAPASVYWTHVAPGGARWELLGLLGALLGSFAAARASGTFRIRTLPDSQWTDAFGRSVPRRWLVGFLGAALTEFAAGMAGGCTASLAVSGGAALAPGAFVFMAGMFAGGIPAALFVYRRRRSA